MNRLKMNPKFCLIIFLCSVTSFAQVDTCITTEIKGSKRITECYDTENPILRTRIITQPTKSKKWNKKVKRTIWDENCKKFSKIRYREKYLYEPLVYGTRSRVTVTWYFRHRGKLCLKRVKRTEPIREIDPRDG